MKLYEITITPQSVFGTPLKGDTLFGSFCWQAAHNPDILTGGLDQWIACYHERPCAIFSSAWPKFYDGKTKTFLYALKRPDMPLSWLFPSTGKDKASCIAARKDNQEKKWMLVYADLTFTIPGAVCNSDKDLIQYAANLFYDPLASRMTQVSFLKEHELQHNTISRLTMTTGEAPFVPYSVEIFSYVPQTKLAIFVLIDEAATSIDKVKCALERIGAFGYGRDASTGCGRFTIEECNEIHIRRSNANNACYALGPVVPEPDVWQDAYYSPFTRFGRHGDELATAANPFKNPVIMADEGAVFIPKKPEDILNRPYIGRAVTEISKTLPKAVQQGYTVYLPFRLEANQ